MSYTHRPLDLEGTLKGVSFRVIPDESTPIMTVLGRNKYEAIVLTVQPSSGGLLSGEYLKKHGITGARFQKFLAGCIGDIRDEYLPGLEKADMVVCFQDLTAVRSHNVLKVIINHKLFPVKLADIIAGRTQD